MKNKYNKDGYVIIRNFLDKKICNYLYEYSKNDVIRGSWYEHNVKNSEFDDILKPWGSFNDGQVSNHFSKYGDLTFDTILSYKFNDIQKHTDKDIIAMYSYYRFYTTGATLEKHTDRSAAEITGTITLGNDFSNLKNKKYFWPICFRNKKNKTFSIKLNIGDALFYKGDLLEHWRDTFLGKNQSQVFLHLTKRDNLKNTKGPYDGRPFLGYNFHL